MPSHVSRYEYDIYVSYRHKDNKYDGWVTEFVTNLRYELEATFKQELSIYFDKNAYDGIHETNDVAETLSDKIKCIVFVAIVSRTYCDPSSFAWANELIPFRDFAEKDEAGLKVKLQNGNVSSRILPIRIHDLDETDRVLFEKETRGMLRPIDFIYRSTGVNRPLRAYEDEPRENQNHTFYRDQINKVAMCVKDIITAVAHGPSQDRLVEAQDVPLAQPHRSPPRATNKSKIYLLVATVVIAALCYYGYTQHVRRSVTEDESPKSIAVLPFVNISNDTEQQYFSDGITEQIINELSQLQDLKVIARTSIMKYKNTSKSIHEIGNELKVTHILEGSVRKSGDKLRITAQLIAVSDQSHLWSEDYNTDLSDIFAVQDDVSTKIATTLQRRLRPEELPNFQALRPSNAEAYEHYLKGDFIHNNYFMTSQKADFLKAEFEFKAAIKIDPAYAGSYAALADLYDTHARTVPTQSGYYNRLRDSLVIIAYQLDPKSSYVLLTRSLAFLKDDTTTFNAQADSAFKYLSLAYRANPNDNNVLDNLATFFMNRGLYVQAILVAQRAVQLNPLAPYVYGVLGVANFRIGNIPEAEKNLNALLDLEPEFVGALSVLTSVKIDTRDLDGATELIKKMSTIDTAAAREMKIYWLAANGDKKALSFRKDEVIYTHLGMRDEAIDELTKHAHDYLLLRNHQVLKRLSDDKRYQALLQKAKEKYDANVKRFALPAIE